MPAQTRRKPLEVIEDEKGDRMRGKEYPKYMADRWRQRHRKRLKVCKYSADEFTSLPEKTQKKVYNTLKGAMTGLSLDMQLIEARMYTRAKKYRDDVRREAMRQDNYFSNTAEKRKEAYMKEANGMRVERQVILLKLEAIYAAMIVHNWDYVGCQFQEVLRQLSKDPERL